MKTKFFFLVVLFLGISAFMYAQTEAAAPSDKKDVKSTECAGHGSMGAKADCKWVDADNDGKCDLCGHTKAECEKAEKATKASASSKSNCAASCAHAKDCGKHGAAPAKEGEKKD